MVSCDLCPVQRSAFIPHDVWARTFDAPGQLLSLIGGHGSLLGRIHKTTLGCAIFVKFLKHCGTCCTCVVGLILAVRIAVFMYN